MPMISVKKIAHLELTNLLRGARFYRAPARILNERSEYMKVLILSGICYKKS